VRHALLAVCAVGRELGANRVQRFAQARDVAVAEDREHATEERFRAAAIVDAQRGQIAHQRLRDGEPQRHAARSRDAPARESRQRSIKFS